MPEESFEEKTEQPTPKKLRDAREDGSVAKSTELNSALVLILGFSFLYFTGARFWHVLMEGMRTVFLHAGQVDASLSSLGFYYGSALRFLARLLGPFLLFVAVVSIASNLLQIGFLVTLKPLEPDITKLSPLKGVKNLVSLRGLVEAVKGILKVGIVILLTYIIIRGDLSKIISSADFSVGQFTAFLGKEMYKVGIIISVVLLAIAGLDYAFQRWNHHRTLMMTKQEVKEERKQLEGDPLVKSRIKSLQREMARRRMMEEVPKATVVVTNPTFIAIALRYEPKETNAPKVVAKGKRAIAERIKQVAVEHGIPIVEDKPLARSLYDAAEIGAEIPPEFFPAVAEVLAYVYRLQNKKVA